MLFSLITLQQLPKGGRMNVPPPSSQRTNGVPVPQLAVLRKQAGLSQRALAQRAGLGMQTISRLEHDTIERLATSLQVAPARLIRSPRRGRNGSFESPSEV
jgi:DNA-binding XRE family transcriptional regulator